MTTKESPAQRAKLVDSVGISARSEALVSLVAEGNTPAAARSQSVKALKHDGRAVRSNGRDLNQTVPGRQRHSQAHCRHRAADPRSAAGRMRFACRRKAIKRKVLCRLLQWRRLSRPSERKPRHDTTQLKPQARRETDASAAGTARAFTRLVRSLQLCSSESSPSPPASSACSRRTVRAYRTRGYGKQLKLYRALRSVRRYQQCAQKLNAASESSGVKGLRYQKMKRKRCLPAAQSPPETKRSLKKTRRRLWRRQLDSSSSDSPVSECNTKATPDWSQSRSSSRPGALNCLPSGPLTYTKAASLLVVERARAEIPPATDQGKTEGSPHTLGRALCEKRTRTSVTGSHLKEQQNVVEANCTLTDFNFLDISSSSESSECRQSQSRLPSTPHVCYCKKKLAKHPSCAMIKHRMQFKTPNDHEVNGNDQSGKSRESTEIPGPFPHRETTPALTGVWSPANSNMGTRHGCQKTCNPSQMETRSETLSQFRAMAPLLGRSEKCPASKMSLIYFKHPTSTSSKTITSTTGDNCIPMTSTPFRKPDTPRPKSNSESLKWKKVLEQRTESTNLGAEITSGKGQASKKCSFQPSSVATNAELPSPVFEKLAACSPEQGPECSDRSPGMGKFHRELLHSSSPVLNYEALYNVQQSRDGSGEITEGKTTAAVSLTPNTPTLNGIGVQSQMVEQQQLSTPHPSPNPEAAWKQSSEVSVSELIQNIFGSLSFVVGVWAVETEPGSIGTGSLGAGVIRQAASQGGLSGCQYYAITIEPLEPDLPPRGQDAPGPAQPRPCCSAQEGGGDVHVQSIADPQ